MRGPEERAAIPSHAAALGADWYPLRLFRELDDALLRLRFNYPEIGLVLIKSRGDLDRVAALRPRDVGAARTTGSSARRCCS